MIVHKTPLPLAYVKEYAKNLDESKPIAIYLKTFCKLSKADADKLAAELRALNNLKLKEENIVKIVDICPRDAEELNKIVPDVGFNEEETGAILAITKNY